MLYKISQYPSQSTNDIQTGTTIEIATNDLFTNIVYTDTHSVTHDDPKKRDILRFDIDIVLNPEEVYWVRAKRLFKNQPSLDHYEKATVLKDYAEYFNGLIYNNSLVVSKPFVYLDTIELLNNSIETFTIRTSKFESTEDGHAYTNWIIKDGSGKVLFASLEDRVNLESIKVPKTADITSKSKLKVYVIHAGPYGIESEVSSLEIDSQTFNFEITSPMNEITPNTPYQLVINKINPEAPLELHRIEVWNDTNTEKLYSEEVTEDTDVFTTSIPWICFRQKSAVVLKITGKEVTGYVSTARYILKASDVSIKEIEDVGYSYTGTVTETVSSTMYHYPAGVESLEIPTGYIPMPRIGSDTLYKMLYNPIEKRLVETTDTLKGLLLPTIGNDRCMIKYTENNLLLVDTWNTVNGLKVPQLFIYKHDKAHDRYSIIAQIMHPEGDKYTANRGNFHQISSTVFLYNPVESNVIYRLDIAGEAVFKPICKIPGTIGTDTYDRRYINNLFVKLGTGKIYCTGTVEETLNGKLSHKTVAYNFDYAKLKDALSKGVELDEVTIHSAFVATSYISPTSFTKTSSVSRMLVNGDILYAKTRVNNDDTESHITVYRYKSGVYDLNQFKFKNEYSPDGSILLLNNNLLLTSTTNDTGVEGGKLYKIFEYK